jgi:hypothetical protein
MDNKNKKSVLFITLLPPVGPISERFILLGLRMLPKNYIRSLEGVRGNRYIRHGYNNADIKNVFFFEM